MFAWVSWTVMTYIHCLGNVWCPSLGLDVVFLIKAIWKIKMKYLNSWTYGRMLNVNNTIQIICRTFEPYQGQRQLKDDTTPYSLILNFEILNNSQDISVKNLNINLELVSNSFFSSNLFTNHISCKNNIKPKHLNNRNASSKVLVLWTSQGPNEPYKQN